MRFDSFSFIPTRETRERERERMNSILLFTSIFSLWWSAPHIHLLFVMHNNNFTQQSDSKLAMDHQNEFTLYCLFYQPITVLALPHGFVILRLIHGFDHNKEFHSCQHVNITRLCEMWTTLMGFFIHDILNIHPSSWK